MKIKDYLKHVNRELVNVSPKEKKKILKHLHKNLRRLLKKNQEKTIVDKLGDPTDYGRALNSHYKLLKTTNTLRLILSTNGKNGNGSINGKKSLLRDIKFVISADMVLPIPTKDMWVFAGISVFLLSLFIYSLYYWQMLYLVLILLPAFIANGAALISGKIKTLRPLAIPVDLEKKWLDGRRIIGNSKTIRGFIFGIISAMAIGILTFYATEYFGLAVYSSLNYAVLFSAILGFGALFGDTVKSFFKRRIGISEGKTLIFFDQVDFLIGAFLISLPFNHFPLRFILVVFAGTFVLHILTNILAFYLRLKKVPL